ncbi:MAG: MerR family transcriptional regulator [Clostridia bacterium]|nr:MerR family transcriptional regulator [Clostridia bacterium]
MTIGEMSRLTGVTIRTLRHYDRIGLLRPVSVTDAGYRHYDEGSLARLHLILLFRELEMPLEEIRRHLDAPDFDPTAALNSAETQLLMQRGHIDRLLRLVRTLQQKGMTHMDFSAFEKHRKEDHAAQAREAWGHTDAWKEYEDRESRRQPGDSERYGGDLMALLGEFGHTRPEEPADPAAQAFVARLQQFITDHFYTCTTPVLQGLADMYETPDFRRNIDRAGGEGTADFLARAIRIFCGIAQ